VAVLAIAYVVFLRPDEATRLHYSYITDGELQIQDGDYQAALESYQAAAQAVPDDPETELMLGVVYEALDQSENAEEAYAKALDLYGDQTYFWAMRSLKYSGLGWHEEAEEDAKAALDLDDQLALGYFALANSYEGQQRIPEAIQALQQCAALASSQGQDELYVIATTRLATLLQGSPM
jgi:tetratricopeptide (TPR) repeat protein